MTKLQRLISVLMLLAVGCAQLERDEEPEETHGGDQIPNFEAWSQSAHARAGDEAFSHWDEEGQVPIECARCHSSDGYLDYLGKDGSAIGSVENFGTTQAVIACTTCHNDAAQDLDTVVFPSGVEVDGLGAEARCIVCHQGRSSGPNVDEALEEAGVEDRDAVNDELGFENVHYYPAAATLYAGRTQGGYQYADRVYDWRYRHVPGYDTCTGCHDAHSLQVKVSECAGCHTGVEQVDDLREIREAASAHRDYDGDGDAQEGIWHEIDGLRAVLLATIQAYARDEGNPEICYGVGSYPYFFVDTDGSGECEEAETGSANAYSSWSGRLLTAAYNYQLANTDGGAYAHNAKYIIELLHDSVADLLSVGGSALDGIDFTAAVRTDHGHFDGASEAARHWDEDEAVEGSCSTCHTGSAGLGAFVELGVRVPVDEPDNGLDCATCHASFGLAGEEGAYALVSVDEVEHPSGTVVQEPGEASNLCETCHTGRAAGASVRAAIARGDLGFVNVHYLPAAGVRRGSEVGLGFEYGGQQYAGMFAHEDVNDCTSCHDPVATGHSFEIEDAHESVCVTCHRDSESADDIRRLHLADYDGDGDTAEPLAAEIEGLAAQLLAQIQATAAGGGADICYDAHAYPYFFTDSDGDGACDPGEASYSNAFAGWTGQLMAAAHNYQISQKEPGAWAHNFDYMAQLLIDSMADLGADTSGLVRP